MRWAPVCAAECSGIEHWDQRGTRSGCPDDPARSRLDTPRRISSCGLPKRSIAPVRLSHWPDGLFRLMNLVGRNAVVQSWKAVRTSTMSEAEDDESP
jgi:hypothetical protein